jgi:hypothetical protein
MGIPLGCSIEALNILKSKPDGVKVIINIDGVASENGKNRTVSRNRRTFSTNQLAKINQLG